MNLLSCLSLQMPWLSLSEFHELSKTEVAHWLEIDDLSQETKQFLLENKDRAFIEAERVLGECEKQGFTILYPGHEKYPEGFLDLEDPPLFLTLQGEWPKLPSLSIVGSREPSRFAVDWINENVQLLYKSKDFLVLSGGARGIDLTSHLVAARNNRPTIVFLPCGLNNIYPPDLRKWKNQILETGGGFVSELPINLEMRKHHFIKRNRLIVAGGDLLFVAEARRNSGSMLTAKIAQSMTRNICTLPASPAMTCAQGSLDLICDNAIPIRDHFDLLTALNLSSNRVSLQIPQQWQIRNSLAKFQSTE